MNDEEFKTFFENAFKPNGLEFVKQNSSKANAQQQTIVMMEAAFLNISPIAEYLLVTHNLDPNSTDSYGGVLINWAAEFQNSKLIELIASRGGNVNVEKGWGGSTMTRSLKHGDIRSVKILLRYGATIDTKRALKDVRQILAFESNMISKEEQDRQKIQYRALETHLVSFNHVMKIVRLCRIFGNKRESQKSLLFKILIRDLIQKHGLNATQFETFFSSATNRKEMTEIKQNSIPLTLRTVCVEKNGDVVPIREKLMIHTVYV